MNELKLRLSENLSNFLLELEDDVILGLKNYLEESSQQN